MHWPSELTMYPVAPTRKILYAMLSTQNVLNEKRAPMSEFAVPGRRRWHSLRHTGRLLQFSRASGFASSCFSGRTVQTSPGATCT